MKILFLEYFKFKTNNIGMGTKKIMDLVIIWTPLKIYDT